MPERSHRVCKGSESLSFPALHDELNSWSPLASNSLKAMDRCHIIIARDSTFPATKADLAHPDRIYFGLNLTIHDVFFFFCKKQGKNNLLRQMLTVSAETTHLSLSDRKTFLNTEKWIQCQRATGGQNNLRNWQGLQCLQSRYSRQASFWPSLHNKGLKMRKYFL